MSCILELQFKKKQNFKLRGLFAFNCLSTYANICLFSNETGWRTKIVSSHNSFRVGCLTFAVKSGKTIQWVPLLST